MRPRRTTHTLRREDPERAPSARGGLVMGKGWTSCWALLIGMLFSCALANAQGVLPQFSADVVNLRGTLDKLYVGSGKVRVESSQGQQLFISIVDLTTQNVLVLDPSQKTYREAKNPAMAATFRLLQPIDPGNPCPQMLQIIRGASPGTQLKLLECKSIGGEPGKGRPTGKGA